VADGSSGVRKEAKWIENDCPIAYKFLWNRNGIGLVAADKRCLKRADFSRE